MEKIKRVLYFIFGRVYIPRRILEYDEDILLHISDTPVNFYSGLKWLLKDLKPKYVIHTGDLVDNIKLELYPSKRGLYERRVKKLIKLLESSSASKIYLVMGNHDDASIVKKIINKCIVIEKSCIIDIDNRKIKVSHSSKEIIEKQAKYNLFGHDLSMTSTIEKDIIFLNGITGINIVTLGSEDIFSLPYPYGTNNDRMCKSNLGL